MRICPVVQSGNDFGVLGKTLLALAFCFPYLTGMKPTKKRAEPCSLLSWAPEGDPVQAILDSPDDAVLAIITAVDGPSYRPVGACMAFLGDGRRVGSLSSGCIESDLAIHARKTLDGASPIVIRYGRGSPFHDLELPCGGGLEILLIPHPDHNVLTSLQAQRKARCPVTLWLDRRTGSLTVKPLLDSQPDNATDRVDFQPDPRFLVFGKGPEATAFSLLVHSAAFDSLVLSTDEETLAQVSAAGCPVRHLRKPELPADVRIDQWSAVVLFFHDHDLEPEILAAALASPAFYVGAQGSRRARDARHRILRTMDVPDSQLARLRGPIGLIASARDPRTLAVSVLAEILNEARGIDMA